jgi:hypothetical protein
MRFPLAAALLFGALFVVSGATRAADCNHPLPIAFPAGATTVTLASGPLADAVGCFQLTARAGQKLTATVQDADHAVSLQLYAPGWKATCNTAADCDVSGDLLSEDNETSWSDQLETSGAYLIVVDNSRTDAEYKLIVELH